MNITKLGWLNIINKPLNTILSLLLMTLGVGIISLLFLLNDKIEQQLNNNLKGVDMVVGAKGSPLQLILSSVYHIDNPTGNISLKEANDIKKNPMIKSAVPLSFGDNYKGFRIVGTTHDYSDLYDVKLKQGRMWSKSLEVVVGSVVADIYDLKIGDNFYGSHGLVEGGHVHHHYAYEVVGVFEQSYSVIDKLILTDTESVWAVHNHKEVKDYEDEDLMITAMLFEFKSPTGLMKLPRKVNETTNLQAAVPAFEINRLISLLGFGVKTINIIAFIIIIVSGLSIFISLYNSLRKRRYELALMRVHGASRFQVVKLILQEGILLSLTGSILGVITSRLILFLISIFVNNKYMLDSIQFNLLKEELLLFPISLLIGIIASCIPALQTYNINIPKILSDG